MDITLYEASRRSTAVPVRLALLELGVPHQRITIDLKDGWQRSPEFLALNPNGKVPVMVVDGTPMFESLAILFWLGERFGVAQGLWFPLDSPQRLEAMTWSAWSFVTYFATVRQWLF